MSVKLQMWRVWYTMLLIIIVIITVHTTAALDPQWRPEATGNCLGYQCQTLTYNTGNVTECHDGDTTINIGMSSSGDLVVTSLIPGLVNLSQVSTWDVINHSKLVMLDQLEGISEACLSMLPIWKTNLEIYTFQNISILFDSVNDTNCGSDNQENANITSGPTNVVISVELENITNTRLGWCSIEEGSIGDVKGTATQSHVTKVKTKCLQCHFQSIYDPAFNRLNLSFKVFEREVIINVWINNTTTDAVKMTNHNRPTVLLIVLCSVLIPIFVICLLVAILVKVIWRRKKHTSLTEQIPTFARDLGERTCARPGKKGGGSWKDSRVITISSPDNPVTMTMGHHSFGECKNNVYSNDRKGLRGSRRTMSHASPLRRDYTRTHPGIFISYGNKPHGYDDLHVYASQSRQPSIYANDYNVNDNEDDYVQLPQPSPSREGSPRVAIKLMKLVFQASKTNTREVFIHYHDDELEWIEDHLIPFLRDSLEMVVSCKEDFCPGSIPVEEQIQSISLSEYVILVLSDSFVKDPECRDVTTRAYSSSPQKVVPLGLRLTSNLESDPLFWSIVQTNGLIEWSMETEMQAIFWQRLKERLSAPNEEQVCEEERIQIVKECLTECANKCEVNATQASIDTEGTRSRTRDRTEVFVYYHDNESLWTNDFLIPYLEETLMMVVQTKEDILPGSVTLEEILKNIQLRDMLIFVISDSFIDDQECRETITRSITIKPNGIVQVILDLEVGAVKHGSGMHKLILGMAHVDNRIHIRDPTESNFTELGVCLNRIVANME